MYRTNIRSGIYFWRYIKMKFVYIYNVIDLGDTIWLFNLLLFILW